MNSKESYGYYILYYITVNMHAQYSFVHQFLILLSIYLGEKLLGDMVILCLTFKEQ